MEKETGVVGGTLSPLLSFDIEISSNFWCMMHGFSNFSLLFKRFLIKAMGQKDGAQR